MTAPDAFLIVGIGASAGGIEALEGFFRGLPGDPGVALVIVTHLSPDRESMLHEILSRFTPLPVRIAADGLCVQPNTVYVAPSNHLLTLSGRSLVMRKNTSRREPKPIDVFFSSLAAEVGELAVGIILSGGDSDGTLGVKAIKEYGGLTLAQVANGFGPQHPDMPNAAISTGLIDLAMPVADMGPKLVEYAGSMDMFGESVPVSAGSPLVERSLDEIYALIRDQLGHDFSGYKTRTLLRRVHRRMHVAQLRSIEAYLERLRHDPPEVAALFRDLLINVTNFFRDTAAFDALSSLAIPTLFEGRGASDTIRVWIPGCATGEEAYSIGILLREYMDRLVVRPRVQIFATDIDERALAVARAARYPEPLLEDVSAERRERFFVADGGSCVVAKEIRELCIFSPHSVLRDPPFSRIDLVSCRNLLIYFGVSAQNQVIPTFHYSLRSDGLLFLGSAENVSQFKDLFTPIDKLHRLFRRRADVTPRLRAPVMLSALRPSPGFEHPSRRPLLGSVALRTAADQQVLERFAPPHVVVNRDGDVVYYSARTGKYLEAPGGVPTRQLLASARKGLKLDLRTLFREAVESGRQVIRDGVSLENEEGRVQFVTLTIEPLAEGDAAEPMFLVLFADQGPVLTREEALARAGEHRDGTAVQSEHELREARDRLQSMIEEYETALEELKSSNEELVSVNEEMQSTNEELEASKEELQSLNEELHTVNAELSGKVEELDRSNMDLLNLFESTDVATVFLDRHLVIRSFTPAVAKVFHILPTDRGRPITDLSSSLNLAEFAEDIRAIFAGGAPVERRVQSTNQAAHYLVRIGPYQNADRRADGVVVTFIDISGLTHSEARQRLLISELQHRTRNLLAVVQSIARQTLGQGPAIADFTDRLAALSRVQRLIGESTEERVELKDLVRLELTALGAESIVEVSGPPVALSLDAAQAIGLALHELATNAVKYGALKVERGTLDIHWEVIDVPAGRRLVFLWHESGIGPLQPPVRKGFGRELIENALAYTLKATAELCFRADGVDCRIDMPLDDDDAPPDAAVDSRDA